MRNAVNQASNAFNQAQSTSTQLGSEASGVGSNLTPFLTQEMLHPQGLGQAGVGAEESAALGGAGGAASAFTGQAAQRAAANRNASGFQASLDDAARQRDKAGADASEGIAAQNANLMQQQQQEGASGLGNIYHTDVSGMLQGMGQQSQDVNSQVNASNSGWLQNTMNVMNTVANLGTGFGGVASGMKALRGN